MTESTKPIQSVEEARSIAYGWAVPRGIDVVLYTRVAENIFLQNGDSYLSKENLEVFLQHFANATNASANVWANHARDSWSRQSQWTVETVKHLAIVNVAGLAGAAALLQKESASNGMSVSLLLFTAGLLMALLAFWLMSQGYSKRALDLDKRAYDVRAAESWESFGKAQRPYVDPGQRWFTAARWIGWVSALSSIAAGALLVTSIWFLHHDPKDAHLEVTAPVYPCSTFTWSAGPAASFPRSLLRVTRTEYSDQSGPVESGPLS